MKRLGVTSLLSALLLSGVAYTGGASAHGLNQTKPGKGPHSYFCQTHKTAPQCKVHGNAAAAAAAAAAAIQAANAAIAKARACTPPTSAQCKALAQAASQAVAHAKQLIARAKALGSKATLPVPVFPTTGAGGTSPVAGVVPVVSSVGNTVAGSKAASKAASRGVTSLPATGGAVPGAPNNDGPLAILGLLLTAAGLGLRKLLG
jgi:hypothetical protein